MKRYLKVFLIIGFIISLGFNVKIYAEENIEDIKVSASIKETPNVSIKGNNNSLIISYEKVQYANKYSIYRSNDGKKGWKKLTTIKSLSYTDKKLVYGKTYYYKVEAIGTNKKMSNVISKKVVPNKVSNLILKPSSNQVTLTWKKTSNSGYIIERSTDNKNWTKVTTIKKSSIVKYTDKKLKSNTVYYYRIKAYQIVKKKKIYGPNNTLETKTLPAAPEVTLNSYSYNEISLKLKTVSGGVKYEIYHSNNKDKGYKLELTLKEEDFSNGYSISNFQVDKPYTNEYYKIRACNINNKCGSYKLLTAQAALSKSIIKSINGTTTTAYIVCDYTFMADGFEIYRSTKKSSGFKKVGTIKVSDSITKYSDKKLKNNTTYYYKIRSYKKVGKKTYYSSYSSTKSFKTSKDAMINTAAADAKKINKESNGIYSKKLLIDMLIMEFNYSDANAKKGVEASKINFKTNAVNCANYFYKSMDSISENSLRNYLDDYGFTVAEINYAIENSNINWKENLIKAINEELKYGISKVSLKELLINNKRFDEESVNSVLSEMKIDFNNQALISLKNNVMSYYLEDYAKTGKSKTNAKNDLINEYSFTEEEANYAINNSNIDWSYQVIKSYESIENLNYSKAKVIEALTDSYDNFTEEEVNNALKELNINFNEVCSNFVKKNYINNNTLTLDEIKNELINTYKFTEEEANYAISNTLEYK